MTHDAFNDQLLAYMENDLDDATRAAMDKHAQQCAECGVLLAELKELRSDASTLPELSPSRDLWSGIAARIEAPVVPIASHKGSTGEFAAPSRATRVWSRRWVRVASIAAGLVLAVSVGFVSGRSGSVVSQVARVDTPFIGGGLEFADASDTLMQDTTSDRLDGGTQLTPATLAARSAVSRLNTDYDREIGKLRALVDGRRNQLDPATVAVIEKNLTVIDSAIAESRKAIVRDPASRFLIESLNQSLESKVELLRVAAALPGRS